MFVQPRVDLQAPKPPPRADLSDLDRKAATVERAREADQQHAVLARQHVRADGRRAANAAAAAQDGGAAGRRRPTQRQAMTLPESPTACRAEGVEMPQPRGPSAGVLADAIRNVQKYAPRDSYVNLQGGAASGFRAVDSVRHQGRRVRAVAAPLHRADSAQLVHSRIGDVPEGTRRHHVLRRQGRTDLPS